MFGIGFPELLLILALALIIIGPERLPGIARTLGKTFSDFKRQADDLSHSFREGIDAADRSSNDRPTDTPATGTPDLSAKLKLSQTLPPELTPEGKTAEEADAAPAEKSATTAPGDTEAEAATDEAAKTDDQPQQPT